MEINWEALRFGLELVNVVGLVGVSIYVGMSNKTKANASAIESVRKQSAEAMEKLRDLVMDDMKIIDSRFSAIETELKHSPTHEDLGKIYEKVNEVATGMAGVAGQMVQINNLLGLMHEHLLNQSSQEKR